jgi:hypothetical protein
MVKKRPMVAFVTRLLGTPYVTVWREELLSR